MIEIHKLASAHEKNATPWCRKHQGVLTQWCRKHRVVSTWRCWKYVGSTAESPKKDDNKAKKQKKSKQF